ncbi:MAG: L,D-transpeptidase [Rhodoferax sp.]|nr:L,D-transpeptidase [Rhodoferax sp.]
MANWVAHSRDNSDLDFIIVDKKFARVYVFDDQARLRGVTPVLLGAAPGDHSVAGIGSRPIAEIRLDERTTPAGRFLAQRGKNASLEDVIWIDYEAAVSMHRVRATDPAERRLERLETASVEDNRISWGCINVPVAFFENIVQPLFAQRRALVYVLPEVRPVREVFGSYDVAPAHPHTAAVGPAVVIW